MGRQGRVVFLKAIKIALEFWCLIGQSLGVTAIKIAIGALLLGLCSCSQILQIPQKAPPVAAVVDPTAPTWRVAEEVYQAMVPGKGSIEVSLQEQKLVLRDGAGEIALETDCSTGIAGRETPTGTFGIKEMIVDKRSNKYGRYVSIETGEVVVEKAWEVSKKPAGTKYRGIAMPYWMRLTWHGVGIHVGKFQRGQRSSFGCIRMPEGVQPLVYTKAKRGMLVTIRP